MLDLGFSVQDFEYFLLIFVRMATFFVTAPFFSITNVPRRFKVGLAFFIALLLYQYVVPHYALQYNTVIGYAILVMKEALAGALIGLGTNLPLAILTFSGKIIDMEIGLSMVSLYDPTTRITEGFTGMFYHYMVLLILMISDMHHFLIRAMIDAYKLIPTGQVFVNADNLYSAATTFFTEYMVIAFRICLPVFATMLVVNIVLGIMAKVAPQMNMFAVGMQIKVLMGMIILFLIVTLLPDISSFIYVEIKKMMTVMVGVFE